MSNLPGAGEIQEHDPRFTAGLLYDVIQVLEKHGYRRPTAEAGAYNRATGATLGELLKLVGVFEGKRRDAAVEAATDPAEHWSRHIEKHADERHADRVERERDERTRDR